MYAFVDEWPDGERKWRGAREDIKDAKRQALTASFRRPQRCLVVADNDWAYGQPAFIYENGRRTFPPGD